MRTAGFSNFQGSIRLSGAVLVLANVIPLIGVIVWGWSVFEIVLLYWSENIIIGAFHFVKMALVQEPVQLGKYPNFFSRHGGKFFFLPFFVFHYGIFCLVHGVFVFTLLGNREGYGPVDAFSLLTTGSLSIAFWGLVASHAFSFFANFLGRGLYKMGKKGASFEEPYGRIIVLHIAIVLGAFVTMALNSPVFLLVILVVGKVILDFKFHVKTNLAKVKQVEPED